MDTQTTAPTQQAPAPAVNGSASIAKTAQPGENPIEGMQNVVWTRERIELIKRQVCPSGVTDDEFRLFIEIAKRSGMDPLLKECFCVPRRLKVATGQNDDRGYPIKQWVSKHEFQASCQGMLARADQFEDYRGTKSAPYYANDVLEIDHGNASVRHVAAPTKDRGPLKGAWAITYRKDREARVTEKTYDECVQTDGDGKPNSQWKKQAGWMVEKCAIAEALRVAYPRAFTGVYIDAEMPEYEREVNPAPASEEQEANAGKTRTERVAAQVAQRAGKKPASTAPEDAEVVEREPVAKFGGDGIKGRPIRSLTTDQLKTMKQTGETNVLGNPNEDWAPTVRENLRHIDAELAARAKAAADAASREAPPEREPGSDDDEPAKSPKAPF